jgi:uncharacterized phage protein (TIGR02220 family)
MTKKEAWEKWETPLLGMTGSDWDVAESAFEWGWAKAIESLAKEKEEEKIPFNNILYTMNAILGRNFKPNLTYKAQIRARWGEGMREEDFARVCRIKKAEWADNPEMAIYLRPLTLFGTKMDSYNNQPEPKKKKIITNHMGMEVEVDE